MKKEAFLENAAKIILVLWLIGAVAYLIIKFKIPDQGNLIDNTLTYTSFTYTNDIPINLKPSPEDVVNSISEFVKTPVGGLDWKLFSKTKSIPYSYKNNEGKELYGVKPQFPTGLHNINGQKIKIQGYMFPLSAGDKQSIFMLGPFPVSCPYHYHIGPALVIEAHALKEIKFDFKAINLEGILELVPRDDEYNLFYRLRDVRVIK